MTHPYQLLKGFVGVVVFGIAAVNAVAVTVTVNPGDPSWANPPGENGGGGSSVITGTAPRSGNGSLELDGDRTRFFGLGNPYSAASNLGLLSDVRSLTFDWMIATDSTSLLGPDYTPSLRLHIWDGNVRSELIWEGAYNGAYGNTDNGVWYTSGASDNFWRFVSGVGATTIYDRDLADWQSIYSANAYVAAISVGVGSSVGSGYHAFADNVTLTTASGSTTYNFEVASVPDAGSSLALLAMSLAGVQFVRRKLRR